MASSINPVLFLDFDGVLHSEPSLSTDSQWLALDDKAYLFRPFNRNLIVVDAATGFVNKDQRRLRQLLRELGQ